jgi:ribosomal protein S5
LSLVELRAGVPRIEKDETMASKQTSRGRKQDRALVAGGQKHEVGYASKKSGKSRAAVKKAVKKVGPSRRKVERELGR